jgi:ATP-dependent protease ClpP protease subunit
MGTLNRRGVLAGTLALAACQQQAAVAPRPPRANPQLSANRIGYVAIQAPLVRPVRDLFIADTEKLLAQNPAEIYLLLNSPGGIVSVAEEMIAYVERLQTERGIRVVTHNIGAVASAACYLFLAGQRRLCVPRGGFLFHEIALRPTGDLTASQLQEAAVAAQQIERRLLKMLTSRAKLSETEARFFMRRTVALNAQEALRDGIIDAVADVPRDGTVTVIRATPAPAQRGATPAPPPPPAL